MPGSLFPNTGQPRKSESVAISASESNLSTTCWPPNTAGAAALSGKPPTCRMATSLSGASPKALGSALFPVARIFLLDA